jgi:hypothetical protein
MDKKFSPCLEWVEKKKEFPKKFMIHSSKVLAALAALSAIGTVLFKIGSWFIGHLKF